MHRNFSYKPPFHVSPKLGVQHTPGTSRKAVGRRPIIYTGSTTATPINPNYLERGILYSNPDEFYANTRPAFTSLDLTIGESSNTKPELQNVLFSGEIDDNTNPSVIALDKSGRRAFEQAKKIQKIIEDAKPPRKSFLYENKVNLSKYSGTRENINERTTRALSNQELNDSVGERRNRQHLKLGQFLMEHARISNLEMLHAKSGITNATVRKKLRDQEIQNKEKKRTTKKTAPIDSFNPLLHIDKILRQGASILEESSKIRPTPIRIDESSMAAMESAENKHVQLNGKIKSSILI